MTDNSAGQAQGAAGSDPEAQGAEGRAQGARSEHQAPEDLRRLVEERERENARYRERIRALEAAEAERQAASMSEAERAQARTKELEAEVERLRAEHAAQAAQAATARIASRLGYRDPDLVWRLVDLPAAQNGDRLDERALERQLRDLLAERPHLGVPGAGGDVGAGRQRQGAGGMNEFIRRGMK